MSLSNLEGNGFSRSAVKRIWHVYKDGAKMASELTGTAFDNLLALKGSKPNNDLYGTHFDVLKRKAGEG